MRVLLIHQPPPPPPPVKSVEINLSIDEARRLRNSLYAAVSQMKFSDHRILGQLCDALTDAGVQR